LSWGKPCWAAARIDTVLVPVDFSHSSSVGLKYAIQFADKVEAKILVLSVLHFGFPYTADGYAMYDLSPLQNAGRAAGEREMQLFVRRVRFGAVKFEAVIEIGSPVDEICALATDRKADLIITPTHGYTGLKHVLIGSTAEQVVRRATCPVLVVPSHPELRIGQESKRHRFEDRGFGLLRARPSVEGVDDLASTNSESE
jgi:nucleotide-binding universal stress UspA family protein